MAPGWRPGRPPCRRRPSGRGPARRSRSCAACRRDGRCRRRRAVTVVGAMGSIGAAARWRVEEEWVSCAGSSCRFDRRDLRGPDSAVVRAILECTSRHGTVAEPTYNPAMRFFSSKPQSIPSPAEALPGRSVADHDPGHPPRPRHADRRPVARGHEDRGLRPRLLLGRREGLLAAPGRRVDRGRLRRRPHPEPDVRGGLLRAGPVTPRSCSSPTTPRGSPTSSCSRRSGRPTTRPRACARATTWARSYRSIILVADDEQRAAAEASKAMYQERLSAKGYGAITTEIADRSDVPVLLRRGLPPAVPRQEPARLLPEPLDRRDAAGRLRGHAAAVRGLTLNPRVRRA